MISLVVYDKKYPNKTLLKKRYDSTNNNSKLVFGSVGIVLKTTLRFEFTYLLFFRKFIKIFLRKKKRFKVDRQVWMFLRPNAVLTKKSKNSRMGKGKGSFVRWCSIIHAGSVLVELKGFNYNQIQKYKVKLEKRLKIPLYIIQKSSNQTKLNNNALLGRIDTNLIDTDSF